MLEENKLFKLREINALFRLAGHEENLEEIEDNDENKEILEVIGNNCVGRTKNGEYLITALILDNDAVDFDEYAELASKIRNYFKKPVRTVLIYPIFKNEYISGLVKIINYKENEEI